MLGVNQVTLVGHVGSKQVNFNQTTGDPIVNLSLATSQGYKNKETNEWVDQTQWHRLILFRHLAKIAQQYVNKGSLLWIQGSLKYRKYIDKNGVEKTSTEIVVDSLRMLNKKEATTDQDGNIPEENPWKPATEAEQEDLYKTEFKQDDDIPF